MGEDSKRMANQDFMLLWKVVVYVTIVQIWGISIKIFSVSYSHRQSHDAQIQDSQKGLYKGYAYTQ